MQILLHRFSSAHTPSPHRRVWQSRAPEAFGSAEALPDTDLLKALNNDDLVSALTESNALAESKAPYINDTELKARADVHPILNTLES